MAKASPNAKRDVCPRCGRVSNMCICDALPEVRVLNKNASYELLQEPIATSTRVIIVQHPHEVKYIAKTYSI